LAVDCFDIMVISSVATNRRFERPSSWLVGVDELDSRFSYGKPKMWIRGLAVLFDPNFARR
jgi:hypothetical protein